MLKGPLGNMPTFRKQLQALMDDPEAQKKILDELKRLGGGGEE
jgi:predicted component of type VI protein secretion system